MFDEEKFGGFRLLRNGPESDQKMPSNKEALSSSDPSVVKAARSNVKGLVTRKINEIEKIIEIMKI